MVRAAFLYWYEPRVHLIYRYVGSAGFQVSIELDRPRAVYLGRSVEYDVAPAIKTRSTWHSETSLRRYAILLLEHTPVPIQIFPFRLNSDPFHRRAVGFVRSILFPSHGHTNHPRLYKTHKCIQIYSRIHRKIYIHPADDTAPVQFPGTYLRWYIL